MEYDFPLFRPPSEARSLIFQVTLGCSWNRCLFCTSYRTKEFLVRPFEEVERDVVEMSGRSPDARKIFLADGDPLAAPTDYLLKVLDLMNRRFPSLERISTYAGPTNLMAKTPEELRMAQGTQTRSPLPRDRDGERRTAEEGQEGRNRRTDRRGKQEGPPGGTADVRLYHPGARRGGWEL